jgi:catechol 2,3-dioxygenase-like lactoylglutathione lyase family enzyme
VHASSITVGVPVSDLDASRRWYERVLGLARPDLEPVAGVVEYRVGTCWLQLSQGRVADTGWVFRIGVHDVRAERDRLLGLGVQVGRIEEIEDVIAFCTFADPDGNQLSLYSLPQQAGPDRIAG